MLGKEKEDKTLTGGWTTSPIDAVLRGDQFALRAVKKRFPATEKKPLPAPPTKTIIWVAGKNTPDSWNFNPRGFGTPHLSKGEAMKTSTPKKGEQDGKGSVGENAERLSISPPCGPKVGHFRRGIGSGRNRKSQKVLRRVKRVDQISLAKEGKNQNPTRVYQGNGK